MSQPENGARYEVRDARTRPIVLFGLALALLIVFSLAVARWVSVAFSGTRQETPHPMRSFRKGPQGPLLQAVPAEEYREHRAWEDEVLSSYGWVDRTSGIARIPIERAMQLVVENGLPDPPDGGGSDG